MISQVIFLCVFAGHVCDIGLENMSNWRIQDSAAIFVVQSLLQLVNHVNLVFCFF